MPAEMNDEQNTAMANGYFFEKLILNACAYDSTELYYDGDMRTAYIYHFDLCCVEAYVTAIIISNESVIITDVTFK